MKKDRKYIITLDEQQYQDIITGLETFHRIICGQVEELRLHGLFHVDDDLLRLLKRQMFPELDPRASYGWDGGSPDPRLDRLQAATYAIYREMTHVRTVDDNPGDWNVYTSETLTTHKAKLPKICVLPT